MDKNKLTIVCTTNKNYIEYTNAFINSIDTNCENINIILRLVNCSPHDVYEPQNLPLDIVQDNFVMQNDKVICEEDIRSTDYRTALQIIKHDKHDNVLFKSKEAVYCSNIKFNTINKLLDQQFKHVLYLDVDTIVRKDISRVHTEYNQCDIATYVDLNDVDSFTLPDGSSYMGWNAGFMLIHNNNRTMQFFQQLESRVNQDMYNFDADEIQFQMLLSEMPLNIKYVDKIYKDNGPEYTDGSHMWSGQAHNKVINKLFNEEYAKYKTD